MVEKRKLKRKGGVGLIEDKIHYPNEVRIIKMLFYITL